jgi:post-segregation antitoxin (ccd killing protein)
LSQASSEWGPDAPTWQRRRRNEASTRVNIYIPPELSARLASARQKGIDINVSRVCQDALERILDAIESQDTPS